MADSFLESVFKTEFVSLLCKRFEEATRRPLPLTFGDTYGRPAVSRGAQHGRLPTPAGPARCGGEGTPAGGMGARTASSPPHRLQFRVKKEGWGGGGTRSVTFSRGSGEVAVLKATGRTLTVSVGDGMPKSSSESAQNEGRGQDVREGAGPVESLERGTNQGSGNGASKEGQE